MGVFNRSSQTSSQNRNHQSIISYGTSARGELTLKNSLHIDGHFEGNIFSDHNVSIGTNGTCFGFISANHVIISGKFQGQVDCGVLEILNGGELQGDVNAREMRLEAGSKFHGHSYDSHQKGFSNVLPQEVAEKLKNHQALSDKKEPELLELEKIQRN